MNITIRDVDLNDAFWITGLSDQLGYESKNDKIVNRLRDITANKDQGIFVVEYNNKVIGWIHAFYALRVESDPFVEIGGMVVDEQYRRHGIGTALTEKVIGWAKKRKVRKIRVRCNTTRSETHWFYERLGYTETKEQKIFDNKLM
ncbi:MAG TPA: GNAT family N-acetyltransferase [Balneolales bacterium]|nr:GNAT family N-acetyltransferase [Balneolales bacterium]